MKLAVLRSGGDACPTCGQHPLIHVLREPGADPEPLHALVYDALELDAGWWRPFKRRWGRDLTRKLEQTERDLVAGTTLPVA